MNKEQFNKKKESLSNLIHNELDNPELKVNKIQSLNKLIQILKDYSFDDRLKNKGLITRLIIDEMEIDYSIGEELIKFDNDIR